MTLDDEALAKLTPEERGRWRALILHRYTPPKKWRAAVDAIACPIERESADNYLRVSSLESAPL